MTAAVFKTCPKCRKRVTWQSACADCLPPTKPKNTKPETVTR